jgi:MFS family permease
MEARALKRWHYAVVTYFSFFGIGISALFSRMPEVKANLQVNSSQLGLVLVFGTMGSLITLIFSGKLVARFGTKSVLITGYTVCAVAMTIAAAAIENHSLLLTLTFLFISFTGYAAADVAVNVDGSAIEQQIKRSVLPRMHAAYSMGAFIGAGIGTLAVALNVSLTLQIAIISAVAMIIPIITFKNLPSHTGQDLHHADKTQVKVKSVNPLKNPVVILLGLGILGITLTEGAGNDWMALSFKEGIGTSATNAALAFVVYEIGMTTTRFFGGWFVDKFGRRRMLEVLALGGVVGVLLVILSHNVYLGWIGSALWGMGVALGFPLFLSAAGEGKNGAKQVSMVATFGYIAFIVGPPTLGLLAQNIGILNMLFVLVGSLGMAAFFARATGKAKA